ncbi:cadherin-like domain-containing protein [Shewanella cyperi]|uniref:Cadherin-like domain-containing protein n=1 Tax=Shewanella cyperi TaxID=2814292 RepID=A0A975AMD1_9GAMM|nr:Ig-like domain-containing protein [Shewanella cyperi]QSX31337.1 cadherin-like domain-containing protein [Shewanella cyperi]
MKNSALMLLATLSLSQFAYAAPLKLEGQLLLDFEDFNEHAVQQYKLKGANGEIHQLAFSQKPDWVKPGQKVRVFGQAKGKQFQVEEEGISLLQSTETQTQSTSLNQSTAAVSGTHSVLVAEVNFAVNPIVRFTVADIDAMVMQDSSAFFSENSYGAMSLGGSVADPVTVDVDVSVCNTDVVAAAADAELVRRGYNIDGFDHVMYLIPTHPKCTWSGKANVNGKRSWIKRVQLSTINHELGHNLGLYHANKKDCADLTTKPSSQCTVYEYGDYLAAMSGTNTPKHFTSFNKQLLGWMQGRMVTVTSDSRVTLSAVETDAGSFPQALRIANGTDENGQPLYYYVEYRQAVGFDSSLATEASNFLNGVRLREGADNNPASGYLLDPTPNSTSYDWDDISLAPGQVFEQQGVRLEVVSSNADSVVLDISFGGNTAQCQRGSTLVSTVTSVSSLLAGDQAQATLKLTNQDNSLCPSSVYDLTSLGDAGLYTSLNQSYVTVPAGQSVNLALTLTADALASGTHSWKVTAQRAEESAAVSKTGSLSVIAQSSNSAPVAQDDAILTSGTASIKIVVLANDSDAEGDALQVYSTTQGRYGSVKVNADNSLTYTPGKRFKGSDSFSYTITDGELTATATVTLSPDSSGTTDGGTTGGTTGGKGRSK